MIYILPDLPVGPPALSALCEDLMIVARTQTQTSYNTTTPNHITF